MTGAIQQLHTGAADRRETTIGGGAQPGEPRLGQMSVGAAARSVPGSDVMVLSDGTAIKSLDVTRLIAW